MTITEFNFILLLIKIVILTLIEISSFESEYYFAYEQLLFIYFRKLLQHSIRNKQHYNQKMKQKVCIHCPYSQIRSYLLQIDVATHKYLKDILNEENKYFHCKSIRVVIVKNSEKLRINDILLFSLKNFEINGLFHTAITTNNFNGSVCMV